MFRVSDLKVFHAKFDNAFACCGLLLLPFRRQKFFHFEKNTGIYRRLDNINVKKNQERHLKTKLKAKFEIQI